MRHPVLRRAGRWVAVCIGLGAAAACGRDPEPAPRLDPAPSSTSPPVADSAEGAMGDATDAAEDLPKGDAAEARRASARRADPAQKVAMDPTNLDRVDMTIIGGIANGATPGAALAVAHRDRIVRSQGYGRLDWAADARPVTDSTIYDLASLTKAVGTTTAVMLLVDDGRIDLDAPISRYLPDWGGTAAKDRVTPRHLLTHTSGLPAFRPFWRSARGREAFLRRIAALDLVSAPGARTNYSDLGMILLGLAVERIVGEPLDVFLERRVFGPLGMRDTGYSPLQTGWRAKGLDMERVESEILPRIPPTEVDTIFRNTHVRGVVHDENAYAMGGVAGHAGLFSSVRDLVVFGRMMLDGGVHRGRRILRASTVRDFTARPDSAATRALGWDAPEPDRGTTADFSRDSFGHTGFTGTSLWIDRARRLVIVLLTNRIDPTRENRRHIALRRAVHEAVQASAGRADPDDPDDGAGDAPPEERRR